jgi:glycosyltransferase involved in cell wall biosynthesis
MKKPIIVLAIPTLQGNGAERVALTLATGFTQQGCEVHIVLTLRNLVELDFESNGKFRIHYFKQHYRWIPRAIRGKILAPLLDRFIIKKCGKPNLVLSNLLPSDRILCHSKLNAYLIIHNIMSQYKESENTEMESIYTKKPVVCVSKGVKEDFDKIFNSQYPSCYIYNPVDMDFVKQKSFEFKPKYRDYLIHVGKFKEQKKHDILIKAYYQSGIENPLILVGQGYLQKECEDLVDKLKLKEKVIFAGFQSNPYPFIRYAKLMILSSDSEGFGMVITESLALDTPVISTNCPSGPSEILPKDNLVVVGDIDALANKIADAVETPSKYVVDLKNEFLLENQTKKYLALIKLL